MVFHSSLHVVFGINFVVYGLYDINKQWLNEVRTASGAAVHMASGVPVHVAVAVVCGVWVEYGKARTDSHGVLSGLSSEADSQKAALLSPLVDCGLGGLAKTRSYTHRHVVTAFWRSSRSR